MTSPGRLRGVVRPVPGGRRPWRVLSPRRRPDGLWICPPDPTFLGVIVGTRDALLHLGAWFRMAAVSPHSLVHLPTGGPRPRGVPWYGPPDRSVDLVIMRRDLGMRPSAWPGVRRRLPAGRPITLRPPAARTDSVHDPFPPGDDDGLDLTEHARTLLVRGPARMLLRAGDELSWAGEAIASDRHVHRQGHAHIGEIGWLLRGSARDMRAGRGTEFPVVGADPRFHKRLRRTPVRPGRAGA